MALKYKYASKGEVPAEHANLYIERDGAFVLDAESDGSKAKLEEFRARAAAHAGFGDLPLALMLRGLGTHSQGTGRMTKAHGSARTTTRGDIDQCARYRSRGSDCHSGRAHHRVMQLTHRERAHQQINITGGHRLAT